MSIWIKSFNSVIILPGNDNDLLWGTISGDCSILFLTLCSDMIPGGVQMMTMIWTGMFSLQDNSCTLFVSKWMIMLKAI